VSTTDSHLSPYLLDSLRLGRLPADGAHAAEAHLGACPACQQLEHDLVAEQRRFEENVLPRTRPVLRARADDLVRPAAWRRWLLVILVPLAPAALVLVLVARPRPAEQPLAGNTAVYQGTKGEASFFVVGRREGRVFPVAGAGPLGAGDSIRFVVTSHRRYLMIASVDGHHHCKVYVPYDGSESAAVPLDRKLELPEGGSIELDATPGPERIFALYSQRPLAARVVLGGLERRGARGQDAVRTTQRLEVEADVQLTELVEKASQ
jgi:hypothetical protein